MTFFFRPTGGAGQVGFPSPLRPTGGGQCVGAPSPLRPTGSNLKPSVVDKPLRPTGIGTNWVGLVSQGAAPQSANRQARKITNLPLIVFSGF